MIARQLIAILDLVNTREEEQKQYMQELEKLQCKRWGVRLEAIHVDRINHLCQS